MDFAPFRLSRADRIRLLDAQTECTVTWLNSEGWPVAAIQNYVWRDGSFWITSFRDRARVALLAREPRSAVTVSSSGSPLEPEQMVSARTLAIVHDDQSTADWFYPAFCRRVTADEAASGAMVRALAAQDRVIVELQPQSWNSFHGARIRNR